MSRVRWVPEAVLLVALSACSAEAPAQATEVPQNQATAVSEEPLASATEVPAPATGGLVFHLVPAESQARFIIGEILGGRPNTVIGVNEQVQGQVSLDAVDPPGSQIGNIEVAAAGFVTDSSLRNRAINQFILESAAHPVITFLPTAVRGLPGAASIGETVQLEITGDLTIRDITQPVTFTAEITLVSEDRMQGRATATIQRTDFELTIPQVPRVAGVDEAVVLELEFVALAQ